MPIERLGVEPSLLPPDSERRVDALHGQVLEFLDEMVNRDLMPGPSNDTVTRTQDILTSGIVVAGLLQHPRMDVVREEERKLMGSDIATGNASCVDGREMIVLRSSNSHSARAPGAILRTRLRTDGKRVPVSTVLSSAIRAQVQQFGEVLEIATPHFKCGEMQGRENAGLVPFGKDPMSANIDEIQTHTVGALTTVVNDQRRAMGLAELPRVVLIARHNMATNGYHYLDDNGQVLASTADMVRRFSDRIEAASGIESAVMGDDFDQLGRLIDFSEMKLRVVKGIYKIPDLRQMVEAMYPDLSEKQRMAFVFEFFHAMALSFVTGKAWNVDNEDLPGTRHEERFGLVTLGNPSYHVEQHFITTAPDIDTAVADGKKMVGLSGAIHGVDKPFVMMAAVSSETDTPQTSTVAESTALATSLYGDDVLGQAIRGGRVVLIPKFVGARLRQPLAINTSVPMDL